MRLIDADKLKYCHITKAVMSPTGFAMLKIINIDDISTAFDLESVIAELEGNSKYMQSEANDLASVGDYGTATKLEGMAQAYKDCVEILKSAANATNGKSGG